MDKMSESEAQEFVNVEIPEGAKQLTLITTDGGDGNNSDHSVWADAKLVLDSSVQKNLYKVAVSADQTILAVGETANLTVSGTLVDDTDADLSSAKITYTSSDEQTATVDNQGVVTALANGLVTIQCNVTLGDITKSTSIDLIVGDEVEGKVWSIASPSDAVGGIFMLNDNGSLSYSVQRDEKVCAQLWRNGHEHESRDFTEGLEFLSVSEATTVDETYTVNSRKKDEYRNYYTERTISFQRTACSLMWLYAPMMMALPSGTSSMRRMAQRSRYRTKRHPSSFRRSPMFGQWAMAAAVIPMNPVL